jgi:D-xylose transport system permease protein
MSQVAKEPIVQSQTISEAERAQKGWRIQTAMLRAYTMIIALLVVWGIFAYLTDGVFLEARNLSNLMRQTAVTGILAVGMLMIIVAGHIDLSVGSLLGLAGGVAALMQYSLGWGLSASLLSALLVGLAIGALQGALVAYLNIPAFIVTLGGLLAWRGVVKGVTEGRTIPLSLESFKAIGQSYLAPPVGLALAVLAVIAVAWLNVQRRRARIRHGLRAPSGTEMAVRIVLPSALIVGFVVLMNSYAGVPIPVVVLLVVALIGAFITRNTTFGRYLYAIGGNQEAARLSGIDISRHVLAVFCLMGLLTGIAAIIYTARVGSASPDAGVLLELDAIAACVIGGASLMGGRGTIFGACLGALFMASLDNGMSLENVRDYIQDIVKGAILVAAVGFDMFSRRRG